MGPITLFYPPARVVKLADRNVKIAEFRLCDLARLQAILDDLEPDPMAEIQDDLGGMDRPTRHKALTDAYDACERGAPVYGDSRARAFFATPAGGAFFVWVALKRFRANRMTPALAAELFRGCTPGQYSRVWRICHGVPAIRSLERLLMPGDWGSSPAPGKSWGEMIWDVAEVTGWTYEQIGRLTITQWIAARNGGKLPEGGRQLSPGQDWAKIVEFQRRYWAGEVDEAGNELERLDDGQGDKADNAG